MQQQQFDAALLMLGTITPNNKLRQQKHSANWSLPKRQQKRQHKKLQKRL